MSKSTFRHFHWLISTQQEILYGWAKNADPMEMPKGVSYKIDPARLQHKYFILQIHYTGELLEEDYTGLKITYTGQE